MGARQEQVYRKSQFNDVCAHWYNKYQLLSEYCTSMILLLLNDNDEFNWNWCGQDDWRRMSISSADSTGSGTVVCHSRESESVESEKLLLFSSAPHSTVPCVHVHIRRITGRTLAATVGTGPAILARRPPPLDSFWVAVTWWGHKPSYSMLVLRSTSTRTRRFTTVNYSVWYYGRPIHPWLVEECRYEYALCILDPT